MHTWRVRTAPVLTFRRTIKPVFRDFKFATMRRLFARPNPETVIGILVILLSVRYAGAAPLDFQEMVRAAFGTRAGGAVVVCASDGKILALVDPESSCRTLHPPGSVFKLVTAAAALQEGVVTESEVFHCTGQRKLGSVVLHCTIPNGHGRITFAEAIAQSCNITFYELGLRLGANHLVDCAHVFGLDKSYPNYAQPQSVGSLSPKPVHACEVARLAIGQASGLGITLLGAAEMTRRIATGEVAGGVAKSSLATIRKGMRLAIESGTCKNAAVDGLKVAGKTGTPESTENPDGRSAWFVGFAPYEAPEIVVVVFAERGRGYDTAAPIARKIFSAYFERGQ